MARATTVTRANGEAELIYDGTRIWLASEHSQEPVALTADDLYWLVTIGGPAMVVCLGGPLAIKGGTAPGEVGR